MSKRKPGMPVVTAHPAALFLGVHCPLCQRRAWRRWYYHDEQRGGNFWALWVLPDLAVFECARCRATFTEAVREEAMRRLGAVLSAATPL